MSLHNARVQDFINRNAVTKEGIPLIALSPDYNDKGEVTTYGVGAALRDEDGYVRAYELLSGEIVPAGAGSEQPYERENGDIVAIGREELEHALEEVYGHQ